MADVSLPSFLGVVDPSTLGTVRRIDQNGGGKNNSSPTTSGSTIKKQRVVSSADLTWEFFQRHLDAENARRQHEMRLADQKMELEKQRFELEKRERESHVTMMNAQLDLIQQLVRQLQQRQGDR